MELKHKKEQEELSKLQTAQLEAQRKSIEQEQNAKSPTNNITAKLTPLIAPPSVSNQRYYSKTFAHVSNALAIQKAKEKVEQLRAAKLQQQPQYAKRLAAQTLAAKTLAQTAAKGAARVAHTSSALLQVKLRTQVTQNLSKFQCYVFYLPRPHHQGQHRPCSKLRPPKSRTIFVCNIIT